MRQYCLGDQRSIASPLPNVDKNVVICLSRIGNNINQIARTLNTLNARQLPLDGDSAYALTLALRDVLQEFKELSSFYVNSHK
jgi:hypothetical protein